MLWWMCLLLLLVTTNGRIAFENQRSVGGDNILPASSMDPVTQARADRLLSQVIGKLTLEIETTVQKSSGIGDYIVFSPLSIACALAVVLLGAGGVTHREVGNLLGVSTGVQLTGRSDLIHVELGMVLDRLRSQTGLEISISNAVFVQAGFAVKQEFLYASNEAYKSDVIFVDFLGNPMVARDQMNRWVVDKTKGRITDLFNAPPSQLTKLVIANAIYFNGEWEYPFFPERATKPKPFYVDRGYGGTEEIEIPTMTNGGQIPYFKDENRKCTIIGLPYKGNSTTMFIVVPEGNIRDFVNNLRVADLEELVSSAVIRDVIFFVPRMKLEGTINLRRPLEDLGVNTLFRPGLSNLSGIADDVFVNEAVHKVDVEITETGTVAAATTGFLMYKDGRAAVVRVNRPFLFFIRHAETGVILFWGTVIKPKPLYY